MPHPPPPRSLHAARRRPLAVALAVVAASTACLPYTVGTTAQPVAEGEVRRSVSAYVIPNAVERFGTRTGAALPGIDAEARWGLDGSTDVGLRVPASSGLVITMKRRLAGGADPGDAALALMPGVGVVNLGQHAMAELSLLASGRTRGQLTPYGGLRALQVAPIARGAVHDRPTAGAFFGLRIGTDTLGVSPELGVFHDPSALGVRRSTWIVVPAVTLHGAGLGRLLRR